MADFSPRASPAAWRAAARRAAAVAAVGLIAGAVGALMALALHAVEWAAFGEGSASLIDALRTAPAWRRFAAVPIGAGLAGLGWRALRRRGPVTTLDQALRTPGTGLPVGRTAADALLQVAVVGSGTSVGRESAPRQTAAALADALCLRMSVDGEFRRVLLAAGAGAGLAAVYNTPWSAVPFALTVTLGRWTLRGALATAAISWIGTTIAWSVTDGLPATPLPDVGADRALSVYAWAFAAIPLCAAAGAGLSGLCGLGRATGRRVRAAWTMPCAMAAAGVLTGSVGLLLPQALGNGKSSLDELFGDVAPLRPVTLAVCLGILVAKPLLTALSFRVGVVGGLLMPSASTGAALGGACGLAFGLDWASVGAFALVGAMAVLSVTQKSPLFGLAFGLELTHCPAWMWPAVACSAFGARGLVGLVERARARH